MTGVLRGARNAENLSIYMFDDDLEHVLTLLLVREFLSGTLLTRPHRMHYESARLFNILF